MDDEFDERRVDDLAHTGAWHQKVADGKQGPEHRHTQHCGHLQTGVFAPVAGCLSKPDGVEELLTVGLSHKLQIQGNTATSKKTGERQTGSLTVGIKDVLISCMQ